MNFKIIFVIEFKDDEMKWRKMKFENNTTDCLYVNSKKSIIYDLI